MSRNLASGITVMLALVVLRPLNSFPRQKSVDEHGRPPRIGIALSGGGARGAAHIGVLKVLERIGVRPDCIAGTSFGALVGGLYAAGYSAHEIEKMFTAPGWEEVFRDQPDRTMAPLIQAKNLRYLARLKLQGPRVVIPAGLLGGQKLMEVLDYYTTESILSAQYDFDRLPIPYRAVATDLITGKPYVFRAGRLSEAIRASIAVPALFTPWHKDDMLLVDGSLSDNLPADVVREMGADYVIAVDVTERDPKPDQVRTIFDVTSQCFALLMKQSVQANYRYADLVLRPDLDGFRTGSYARMKEIIECGVTSAQAQEAMLSPLARDRNLDLIDPRHGGTDGGLIDSIACETNGQAETSKEFTPECKLPQIKTRPLDHIDLKKISTDLQRLRASNRFENAGYDLEPLEEERYRLRFHLTESAAQDVGIGLRYTRDLGVQALMEFNTRDLFHTPSFGMVSTRFGGFQQTSASIRLIHPRVPFLFLEPQLQRRNLDRFEYGEEGRKRTFVDKRQAAQLSAGATWFDRFEVSVGFRAEVVDYFLKGVEEGGTEKAKLNGLRIHARYDTLDAQEFPRHGTLLDVQVDDRRRLFGADVDPTLWQANLERHFSYSDKTVIGVRVAGVMSTGSLPYYEFPRFGGYTFLDDPSRPLVGYERDQFKAHRLVMAGLSGRRQLFMRPTGFFRRGFFSAEYNSAKILEPSSGGYALVHGGAIGLSFDTVGGPMRVATGFNQDGKVRFYLLLGPSF